MSKRKRMARLKFEFNCFTHHDDNDKQRIGHRIPRLPEDIIFNIISWGSAEFLQNIGRSVCKSWAKTIYSPLFIEKHLSRSIPILFFRYLKDYEPLFYIELQGEKLRYFDYEVENDLEEILWDSSFGLVLYEDRVTETLSLRNSINGQISKLPYPPDGNRGLMCKMNVAYLSLTGEVKVICNERSLHSTIQCCWSILTVGADGNMAWRMLNNTTTTIQNMVTSISRHESFFSSSVGGVVIYWTTNLFLSRTFIAIDLHDETFHLVHTHSICEEVTFWELMPMGKELYVISVKRDFESLCREDNRLRVWKIRDFRQSEWMESFTVKVDYELGSFLFHRFIRFIAWYENHKILVILTSNYRIMAHNFKVGRSYFIANCFNTLKRDDFWPHTTSLVRW